MFVSEDQCRICKEESERGLKWCREGGPWVLGTCSGGRRVYKGKAYIGFTMKWTKGVCIKCELRGISVSITEHACACVS